MGINQQYTRIDTLELKTLLYQKIGQQRSDKYFNLLNKLFSLHITKNTFDKLCIRTIGRENLPLHNRLIASILKNTILSKVPPPTVKRLSNSLNVKVTKGSQLNSLQSLYGDPFPRKIRSPRARKFKDRPSPFGPNGKPDSESGSKVQQALHQSPTELHSLGSRPPIEVLSVEDGEEVVSGSPGIQSRSPVTAPLGVSLKLNTTRKRSRDGLKDRDWCQITCELPDSVHLRSRLKQKLEGESVSISEDCANTLNVCLDAYLKRLIEPCTVLGRSKRMTQMSKISVVSVLDFGTTLESNPYRLGADWPILLEKLRFKSLTTQ